MSGVYACVNMYRESDMILLVIKLYFRYCHEAVTNIIIEQLPPTHRVVKTPERLVQQKRLTNKQTRKQANKQTNHKVTKNKTVHLGIKIKTRDVCWVLGILQGVWVYLGIIDRVFQLS